MRQHAPLFVSVVALAVTGYLYLSPKPGKFHDSSNSLAEIEKTVASECVETAWRESIDLVESESVKWLLDKDLFLYPTDQMYRLFDVREKLRR